MASMTDRRDKYSEETPFRSFRLPTREADRQLVKAAREAGITVSEFIRRALAVALSGTNQ
jgi:hypothetical protein